jgi:hypothetical protein
MQLLSKSESELVTAGKSEVKTLWTQLPILKTL